MSRPLRDRIERAEARALVSGDARRDVEHARGWEAHQRDCKAWREARAGPPARAAAKPSQGAAVVVSGSAPLHVLRSYRNGR